MHHYLFDWGDTLMLDQPGQRGPMCDWPELRVTKNAVSTLSWLSRRAKCHLATNAKDSDEIQIRRALARGALDPFIDYVFCYRSTGHLKPSSKYFDSIIRRLSCAAAEITMIGDDLEIDVLGAMVCGLNAVWYNPKRAPVPDGIIAIEDLSELVSLAQQRRAPHVNRRPNSS